MTLMPRYPKLLISILIVNLLSACGFHLRGNLDFPPGIEPFYISSANPNDRLHLELVNIFNASDIELAKRPDEANYQLVISSQKKDKRSTAIGNDGRIAEYQLIESVTFLIKDKSGQVVTGPNNMTERRTLQNNPNRVISTESEEQLIRDEMEKSLARKITRQLSKFDYRAYEEKMASEKSNAP